MPLTYRLVEAVTTAQFDAARSLIEDDGNAALVAGDRAEKRKTRPFRRCGRQMGRGTTTR